MTVSQSQPVSALHGAVGEAAPAGRSRPILFSASMVRALLAGTKTQTRRIVKPQPNSGPNGEVVNLGNDEWALEDGILSDLWRCPYGVPGDMLWVRETWGINHYDYASPIPKQRPADLTDEYLVYHATEDDPEIVHELSWPPSIHMPRWASRITLRVTDVRVERLNEISEADAKAEGIEEPSLVPLLGAFWSSRDGYAKLWEHINGAGSWAANPWVWALSFEVIRRASTASPASGQSHRLDEAK